MTAWLLAIDPGVNLSGWALFEHSTLHSCGHDSNLFVSDLMDARPMQLVIERPRTYNDQSLKPGGTQDLLDLSCEVGFFCGVAHARGKPFRVLLPQQWKGQTPKKVTAQQLTRTLTEEEWERVPKLAKKYLHNVLDALALGTRTLERRMREPMRSDLQ